MTAPRTRAPDDEHDLELDLPGIEKKDVAVEVVGRLLPTGTEEKKASGTLIDGVPRITLPETEASRGSHVDIA